MQKKHWTQKTAKLVFALLFAMILTVCIPTETLAADVTLTVSNCVITGQNVNVAVTGAVPQAPDGMYYLFELKPYEEGIGARQNYCATAPAAGTATFSVPLDFNTANSKLYSRFVVAVSENGVFVPVSNESYITNPEAVATKATGYPMRSKKGLTADWQYSADLSALGAGYASYELDVSRFFTGGGTNYTYNGKTYSFNSGVVSEYDIVCRKFANEGCNVIMVIKNSFNAATADLIPPMARVPGKNCYALNVAEQAGAEKVAALMSFLANRYSGSNGTIHTWIIGNEANNNSPWHYAGDVGEQEFSAYYAKEFRLCYNAIKSQNAGARVFINIDQRWMHTDSNALAYPGRNVLDYFAQEINAAGNIDWGLSIHPHPVPLFNCQFWNLPPGYSGMKNLVVHSDDTRMVNPTNLDVVTNHMAQPFLLSPSGAVRHILISEMGFTSANPSLPTDQNTQAAAMQYAYKLAASNPFIEGIVIHRQIDHASEVANDGMAVGIRDAGGAPKVSFNMFKYMDTADPTYANFALPYIGASSWADVGLN